MKKRLKWLLFSTAGIYLLICLSIYGAQNMLLFPADAAQPVAENWTPSLSNHDTQAMINGQCGRIHVVKWPIQNDKGTIMIFHGNGESVASVENQQVPTFQQLGYSVMTWDYPGYGKSTNCWFNQDDLLRDSETAYQWLVKKTPESQIIVYGHSVGTGLAIHVASQHPVRQVLLVSPYDALVNVAKDHMPFFIPVSLISHLPLEATHWLAHVQCSVYAIHGLNDALIKPDRAAALFNQAKSNAQIDWIANATHGDITLFKEFNQWLITALAK